MRRQLISAVTLFLQTTSVSLLSSVLMAGEPQASPVNQSSSRAIAAEADGQIVAELQKAGVAIAERCSDEDFLRRASLDITGQLPSPAAVAAFRANTDANKRSALIDQLIESPEFGLNWSRYWRDVIYIRATEQRSRLNQEEFTNWMADQWNKSVGWNTTVSSMLTAVGNVQEHPETALIFAQGALPEEVAAEACRVFLGIQLQCANCHDHPSDIWKREQFHQLAAYFPRIAERRSMAGMPEYEIVSVNMDDRRGDFMLEHPDLFIRQFDRDNDNKLSAEELKAGPKRLGMRLESRRATGKKAGKSTEEMKPDEMESGEMQADRMMPPNRIPQKVLDRLFDFGDTNKDGLLTLDEIKSLRMPQNKKRGSAEHRMVNLKDPNAPGEVVDPKFFVDGTTLARGKTDEERRQAVALAFTSKENPWFARAIVNRVWAEMLGEGFYMPVDDLGPNRTARYPQVLDLICQNFVASGYDPKWLVRTVANTEAYQRKIRSKSPAEDDLPFASATPVPLRADVIFNSLAQVFGVTDGEMNGRSPASAKQNKDKPRSFLQSPRFMFDNLFGIDPSVPKDDVIGNIPQSLMMMNSRIFRARMAARGNTPVVKILSEQKTNRDALRELYLLVLSREPSESEIGICTDYIAEVKDRPEAFEDLMWSLVNSSEFISRR